MSWFFFKLFSLGEFCVDFGDFFLCSIGWWIFVDGGGLYLWVVVAGCAVYGGVLLKVLSVFFLFC